jgi:hypothetical protein
MSRVNQYRKQFEKWGVKKKGHKEQTPRFLLGPPFTLNPPTQTADRNGPSLQFSASTQPEILEHGREPSIFASRHELDSPWSDDQSDDAPEAPMAVQKLSDPEVTLNAEAHPFLTNAVPDSSPRSSTLRGWAAFRNTSLPIAAPNHVTMASSKENPEERDHQQQPSFPSQGPY